MQLKWIDILDENMEYLGMSFCLLIVLIPFGLCMMVVQESFMFMIFIMILCLMGLGIGVMILKICSYIHKKIYRG